MKTKLLAALAFAFLATPAQAQTTPPDDPRVIQARANIDALNDLVRLPACNQTPEPARWLNAGTPDQGMARPLISAHRGALTLAPENTLASYEYAFAFGVALVEVDIQQTKDGKFVALHDDTVDRTTNGTGNIRDLTYDEVRALNAADYAPWKDGPYDGSRVASLAEVLQLAQRVGGGLELDIKGSVTEEGQLAQLVKQYGLIEESIFNSGDIRIFGVDPAARIIYNRDRWEPPYLMYEIASVAPVFGSRRDEYNAESAVAIHDGCGVLMPHAYDAGPDEEVNEFLRARAMGADGVQTNQPEKIVAAAGIPAPSKLELSEGRACLVNRDNGLGFPTKPIVLDDGSTVTAGKGGCVDVPTTTKGASFAGDGAVTPSSAALSGVGGTVPATLALTLGAPASFGAFVPGVAREYAASTTATVVSTAADATLTVADPTGTGKLVNGAFTLAQPLQGLGAVKTWTQPTTNEVVSVEFKQAIGANEALRTGAYASTLTFTLSTTAP